MNLEPTVSAAKRVFIANGTEWIPSTAEVAEYFLCVLPPIYGQGCFACSEPSDSNRYGEAVFLTFRNVNYETDTAEARYCTRAEIKGAFAPYVGYP